MIAAKRMFSSSIVESDEFIDMPGTSQLLYFHLAMRADNDGVVIGVNQLIRAINANIGDLRVLFDAGLVLLLNEKVIVITDWHVHNNIRFDSNHNAHGRYYTLVKELRMDEDRRYYLQENSCSSPVGQPETSQRDENSRIQINREQQQKMDQISEQYNVGNTVSLLLQEGWNIAKVYAGLLLLSVAQNVKNPGAWLRRAVENGWTNPMAERRAAERSENEAITKAVRASMEKEYDDAAKESLENDYYREAARRHQKDA